MKLYNLKLYGAKHLRSINIQARVYQFVKTKDDLSTWQLVPKNVATFDTVIPDKINYQLFLGGIVVRDCFLLNINTGATWVLVKDSNDYLSFENFE